MRIAGTVAMITILLVLLIGAGLFAYAGLPGSGEQLPSGYYTSMALGAVAAILVGAGLMGLVFYSSRRGYDEPPRLRD